MSNPKQDFIAAFKSKYPALSISSDETDTKKISIIAMAENILDIALVLRDSFGFIYPNACGAVDYPNENRIQLIYYLINPNDNLQLFLRIDITRNDPRIHTLTTVWEAMSFHEREAHEMFGIDFTEHTNLVPLLLPPDWKGGYPLRKDFKGEGAE